MCLLVASFAVLKFNEITFIDHFSMKIHGLLTVSFAVLSEYKQLSKNTRENN